MDYRSIYLIILLVHHSLQKASNNFAGPFDVIVQQMEPCEDEGTREIKVDSHRISRISRTKTTYTGRIYFGIPVDETVSVKLDVSVWGNGGWKSNYFQKEVVDPCSHGKKVLPVFFNKLLENGNITNDCPIPKGSFLLKDLPLDADLNAKVLPYNKHKAELSFWHDNKKIGCEVLYFEIARKLKKSKH